MAAPNPIQKADELAVAKAAGFLLNGGLVAVPTETVYGLAANAASAAAVAEIYRTKGRPDFNPLIVHVPDLVAAHEIAQFSPAALALAAQFWPGPLTMVLPLREGAPIARAVTAGLSTIALRCPSHPVMQSLLLASGLALAAPSANRSGSISPTRAEHVLASLGDAVPLILDAGPCRTGIESTIVAVRDEGWQLLRPGPVSAEIIEAALGQAPLPTQRGSIVAPGQLASHYAPTKAIRLNAVSAQSDEWMIGFGSVGGDDNLSSRADLADAASRLFDALHRADASNRRAIAVAPIPLAGIGVAINDRLARAAA